MYWKTLLYRYRKLIITIILVVLTISYLSSDISRRKDVPWYDRVILFVITPFQAAATRTIGAVRYITGNYVFLINLRRENEKLKDIINQLRERNDELKEVELENERLRKLLKFSPAVVVTRLPGEVIAYDASGRFKSVRINRGFKDGVTSDLAVVTSEGVVGRTFQVGSDYSDVLLIIDSNSGFDGVIQRSRARGIVRGFKSNACRLDYTERTEDVAIGDTIVTSGLGGVFPKGLRVGVITKIEAKPYGIFQQAEVIPGVDFAKLEEVFVLLKE